MKRLTRALIILAFAAANLALVSAPADAFRFKSALCLDDEGENVPCCMTCWFFCDDCRAAEKQ